jgi:hypothetical protein
MRLHLMVVGLFCYATTSFCQVLTGKLVEKQTAAPIAYANVVVIGTSIGTATDENGNFSLRIDQQNENRLVRFSSIGYLSSTHRADSLLALRDKIVIELAAEVTLLGEISVDAMRITPRDIIANAVKSIPKNYNQKPFNAEYISRISTQRLMKGSSYNLESVLFGYYQGYGSHSERKFKILHKREQGTNPIKEYQYWPSHELFQADLLSHPEQNGVFALKHLDKFELTLEDVTLYDQDTVQVIDYILPKPRKATTGYGFAPKQYNGKLYITTSGAIVRHLVNAPPFQFDIIYRRIGEHYYPYVIRGNRIYKNAFRINNVISLRQIELNNIQKVGPHEDDWDVSKVAFNETYWKENYPTKY